MCGYMHEKLINFIKYNNAFTIAFVVCFFGFGISFAASPELRESVYSSEETVVSVDNSSIVSADLDNFNFNLRINSVTEDEKNYYVVYSYQTLTVEDSVWQNKEIEKTLTVSKEALGGKDLGLYAAEELGENINYELSYLKRVQKLEKEKGESQKVVTVEYSGLIGKLLDPKEKVIEGYSPVILEPIPEVPATVESNPEEVIVSTPYVEPQTEPQPEVPTPLPEGEGASATEAGEVLPLVETPAPVEPTPEEMIDEELVQEVVEELLQDQAIPQSGGATEGQDSTTPVSEPAAPAPEATSTPEAVPNPSPEATTGEAESTQ